MRRCDSATGFGGRRVGEQDQSFHLALKGPGRQLPGRGQHRLLYQADDLADGMSQGPFDRRHPTMIDLAGQECRPDLRGVVDEHRADADVGLGDLL